MLLLSACEKKYTYIDKDEKFNPTSDKEKLLSSRQLEYLEAYTSQDFEKAFLYEIPYEQFLHPVEWYKQFNKNNVKEYHSRQLYFTKIDENTMDIRTNYKSKTTDFTYNDRWFYVNGNWYHEMKTTLLPKL